ncbi:methyl-accepting chemotaxis protein [Sphingomonas sp. RS6]
MKFFVNMKIQFKILAMLGLLGVATLSMGWYGGRVSSSIDDSYSILVDTRMPDTSKLVRTNRYVNTMMYDGYRVMAYDGRSAEAKRSAADEVDAYEKALKNIDEVVKAEPETAAALAPLRALVEAVHAKVEPAIAAGLRNENDTAKALLAEADKQADTFSREMRDFNDKRMADATALSDSLSATAATASFMLPIIAVIVIMVCMALAVFLTRKQISNPLTRLQDTMRSLAGGDHAVPVEGTERGDEVGGMAKSVLVFKEAAIAQAAAAEAKQRNEAAQKLVVDTLEGQLAKLADGDLTATIEVHFTEEYEGLKRNYNAAVSALRELIAAVMESAETISTGSAEIAQASEDLARRTEGAAASLEETSAAVSQMDQRIKATAAASTKTVERATGAIGVVASGRSVADEAMQAMTRVSESAKGIDNVIEGLDKIAFQTRVLAMNAAVEAGRAGEAGRGFAVVADLVSALAMRAEEEAGRARDQLTATQTDINAAVDMVQRVDSALGAIVGDVNEVHKLLETMATDNQVQASAVTQVATAVNSIDQTTQQNAAMVEETSAAARNLSSEVASLSERALRFNAGDRGSRKPVRSRVHAMPVQSTPAHAASVSTVRQTGADVEEWASF